LLGGAGPFLAAIVLTHFRENAAVRRAFWVRIIDPRRIQGAWWVASLLLHPAIVLLAFAADVWLGGSVPALPAQANSAGSLLSLAFFVFWFGPLPEEIGWRGFALDRLQARMGPISASLLLGAAWALWHVPLFFVPDTFQAGLGLGSTRALIFLSTMVPLSVLMGWVYNNTSRSTLSAALVHFSGNVCGALFPKTSRVAALELGFLCLAAVVVVLCWRGRCPTSGCS
jgi:membrane protease YdiL (CAAX protease family)